MRGEKKDQVAPLVGVRIEILPMTKNEIAAIRSLPSWECGLKYFNYMDAYIDCRSLPTRECGLKSLAHGYLLLVAHVAPHAGVWIEI